MNRIWHALKSPSTNPLLTFGGIALAAALATTLALRARAAGIPGANALIYAGYLETPKGEPMTTSVDVVLNVWDAATKGTQVCGAPSESVTPVAGRFQIQLPDECTAAVGANPELWLEPLVNGTSLGRSKLGAVPYAVEAAHAVSADAAAKSGALATQLAVLQADVDGLKARLDGPLSAGLSKFQSPKTIVSGTELTWLSGTDAAKLAPGRYWVFNTARVYTQGTGCAANCQPFALVYLKACMKVGSTLTPSAASVVVEAPRAAGIVASLPAAAIEHFDIAKETADVQLGLCALRTNDATLYDAAVADVYSVVMSQPR